MRQNRSCDDVFVSCRSFRRKRRGEKRKYFAVKASRCYRVIINAHILEFIVRLSFSSINHLRVEINVFIIRCCKAFSTMEVKLALDNVVRLGKMIQDWFKQTVKFLNNKKLSFDFLGNVYLNDAYIFA